MYKSLDSCNRANSFGVIVFIVFIGAVVALAADPMEKHRAIPNTIATERATRPSGSL